MRAAEVRVFLAIQYIPGKKSIYVGFLPGKLLLVWPVFWRYYLHQRIDMHHARSRLHFADGLYTCDGRFTQGEPELEAIFPGVFIRRHPSPLAATKRKESDLVNGRKEIRAAHFWYHVFRGGLA